MTQSVRLLRYHLHVCFVVFFAASGMLHTSFAQLPAKNEKFNHTFFLGSHLFRVPMPPEAELIADMHLLKQGGFNLVKIQTHWSVDEPLEGRYDFSHYERALEEADRLGLQVYIGFTLEQAPLWLYRKYPDARMLSKNGVQVLYETPWTLPSDGKPGPCGYHPGVMAAQKKYITAFVKAIGRHKSVAVWNLWQEIALWPESNANINPDYNKYSIDAFRSFLKQRFKTVDALNASWGSQFPNWESVEPSRTPPLIGSGQDVLWKYFMDNVYIQHILDERYAAVRAADSLKRPIFAHKGGMQIGSGLDWNLARSLDFMGSSSYPAWSSFGSWDDEESSRKPIERYSSFYYEMWHNMSLPFDYLRCANKPGNPVWAAEFQGGPISSGFQKGRVPTPDDIRRWMLTAVGSGASTISYWVTRAEIMAAEHNGFSLLESEGNTTPRFEEASRIGKALMKYQDIFANGSERHAKAGIIVDEENYQFCSVYNGLNQHLTYNLSGWYKYLYELGIEVDFLRIQDLNAETATQYKALVLPFPISLSDSAAGHLVDYMKGGGNLISEAGIGRINQSGFNPRGEINPVIRKAIGYSQKRFQMVREPDGNRWMPKERNWSEFLDPVRLSTLGSVAGDSVLANFYLQTFDPPAGSQAILQFGNENAGFIQAVGQGRAIMLGTFIGYNATAHQNAGSTKFVGNLLRLCGVESENKGALHLRKRLGDHREAWLLTNTTDHDITQGVDVSGFKDVKDLFDEPVQVTGGKVNLQVKSLDIKVLILSK